MLRAILVCLVVYFIVILLFILNASTYAQNNQDPTKHPRSGSFINSTDLKLKLSEDDNTIYHSPIPYKPPEDAYRYSRKDFKGKSWGQIKDFVGTNQERINALFQNYLRYVSDGKGNDILKYPEVTLREGGDCEDLAFALADILEGDYSYIIYFFEIRERESGAKPDYHAHLVYRDLNGWRTILFKASQRNTILKHIGISPAFSTPEEARVFIVESFRGALGYRTGEFYSKEELIDHYLENG